jgi:polar amino acid transport system permease protein
MLDWLPYLLGGVPLTILISVLGIMLAVPLALVAALARLSKNPLLNGVAGFYISFIRGTPLIVQIFFIYLGLPQLASYAPEPISQIFILGSVTSGVLALGINYGAYMAEIFRVGMTSWQTTRRIVLPQAVRVSIPPTGNEFIAMIKDSALVGIVGTQELFFRASKVGRQYFHSLETLVVAAMIYWILTSILSYFQAKLERRLERGYVRDQPHGH